MGKIRVRNLYKSFDDQVLFKDLSFDINIGGGIYVGGPSGSGKTSLLRILLGLDKDYGGKISGLDGLKKSCVFQEDRLIDRISIIDNIKLGNDKLSNDFICDNLKEVGLFDIKDKSIGELSGGMKRRVSLLRALLCDFDIVFLDEPFKGLDSKNKEICINYLKKMTRGKTLFFISHDDREKKALGIGDIINIG